jgi:hypothetical protein
MLADLAVYMVRNMCCEMMERYQGATVYKQSTIVN